MADATGEADKGTLRVDFDRWLMLQFRGSTITSDAGLLAYRELEDTFRLTDTGADTLGDMRTGGAAAAGGRVCCANRCLASASPCWLSTRRLRSNSVAARLTETEYRAQPTGNPENVGLDGFSIDEILTATKRGRAADQIPPILDQGTAGRLGLFIPPSLLAQADHVIK